MDPDAETQVRRFGAAFSAVDEEAFAAALHPDVRLSPLMVRAGLVPEPYQGRDAARAYLHRAHAVWDGARIEIREVSAFAKLAVAFCVLHARIAGQDVAIPTTYVVVLEDGLIREMTTYADLDLVRPLLGLPVEADEVAIELEAPAEPDAVPVLRRAALRFAAEQGAGEDAQWAVATTVSEAATNAVLHAYVGAEPGLLRLRCCPLADGFELRIADRGSGLRPRDDSPGLGLGLGLMHELSDELQVVGTPPRREGTEVRLVFRPGA